MAQQLLTNPIRLANRALKMLSIEQAAGVDILEFYELSEQIVVRWTERSFLRGEFGSSDRTFMMRDLLESAGFKTRFVNHRLAVMAS
jgi:hypothetical protein